MLLKAISGFVQAVNNVLLAAVDKLSQKLHRFSLSIDRILAALAASLMLSYIFHMLGNGNFSELSAYFNSINWAMYITVMVVSFAVIIGMTVFLKSVYIIPWVLMLFTTAVSVLFAVNYSGDNGVYFALGVGLVDFVAILWEVRGDKLGLSGISISRRVALIFAGVLFIATTFVFGYFTSAKYLSYYDFTFDFGIFSQMYERMASTGAPVTTVERSYMMSHFGVHFSPIFYLFLPGYYIFRTPVYLFYVQAASVAAGVFAVYLLAGKLGLSGKMTVALELIYAFYPCLFNGTFYDFHENKFLTTIILFLFYFIIARKPIGILGFSLLLLSVKEDAAIYLIVIALFVLINRKEIFTGVFMLLLAIGYFIVAQQVVAANGTEGVMMSRLGDYFINGDQSFGSVLKSIVFNMGYLIQQMFTAEKLPFVLWMFAPVLFAPFMTKKISYFILLLPILPINLMQSWQYQYNVDYQYTYGVAALIIMCAIFAVMKMSTNVRRTVVLTSVCMCLVMSVMLVAPKIKRSNTYMEITEVTRVQADAILEEIPEGASVTASHSIVPHLYKTEWLFTVPDYYERNRDKLTVVTPETADYFVVDTRYNDTASTLKEMMGSSYTLVDSGGFVELYKRN